MQRFLILSLSALGLSGCDLTDSGFAGVSGDTVNVSLFHETNGHLDGATGTVAFVVGEDFFDNQIVAYSGIRGDWDVGAQINAGSAIYDAEYRFLVVDRIHESGGYLYGDGVEEDGTISLLANFDAMRVTGSGEELIVDADIVDQLLRGQVIAIYSDPGASGHIDGELLGYIGAEGVIAAFHGHDGDTVVSGGIITPFPD